MKAKELEKKLGLSARTIYYYEVCELLKTDGLHKKNQDYGQTEESILKKIVVFRKLGMDDDAIETIFNGEARLQDIIKQHHQSLLDMKSEFDGAKEFCSRIINEKCEMDSFDEDVYWNLILDSEEQGSLFFDISKDVWKRKDEIIFRLCEIFIDFKHEKGIHFRYKNIIITILSGILLFSALMGEIVELIKPGSFLKCFLDISIKLIVFFGVYALGFYLCYKNEKILKVILLFIKVGIILVAIIVAVTILWFVFA